MLVTRFAPSPTGFLHIGSVRTALFAYLYAKRHAGTFRLRIEDTDRQRSTQEAVEVILAGMKWLGLHEDGDIVYQTHREPEHLVAIQRLIDGNQAYRCTCTRERLDTLREKQMAAKQKPRYDGKCRDAGLLATEESYVIRFRTPQTGSITFADLVKGSITISNTELDDLIIQRSDGTPTYNLSVVMDDAEMGVTHVIRGDDHINNTPRQIHLYQALGYSVPAFAHIPMILGDDGKRLSKRHGAVSVIAYQEMGIVPEAMINALARLGWSSGDREMFSMEALCEQFDLSGVNQSAAAFNLDKVYWFNQQHLKMLPYDKLTSYLAPFAAKEGIQATPSEAIIGLLLPRCQTLIELAQALRYFYLDDYEYEKEALAKWVTQDSLVHFEAVKGLLLELTDADWQLDIISPLVKGYIKTHGLKFPQVAQPLRLALTGTTESPSIDQTIALMGRDKVLARLERATKYFHTFVGQ